MSSSSSSSIRQLPLPVDEESAMGGWDETIDDAEIATNMRSSLRTSLAAHALAHEHWVCGIAPEENTEDATSWLAWKTSLAPHRVCQVVSNVTGNLIAATLDNGTISILRGTDGTVLATRRVAPEGCRLPAAMDFVTKSEPAAADTLIILPPEDGPPILVSNMQGQRLNSVETPGVVAEAARSMGLHALRIQDCDDIRAIRGLALPGDKIRFALVDGDGHLSIVDYNLNDKQVQILQRNVDLGYDPAKWEVDMDIGIRIQSVPDPQTQQDRHYLAFSIYSTSTTKFCWMDLQDMSVVGEYTVHSETTLKRRARLLALEYLPSSQPETSLAMVLAVKFPAENATIETRVVQAVVGDTLDSRVIKAPHLLYTIPVPSAVQCMTIAPLSNALPYSFRCKTWLGNDKYDCRIFSVPAAEVSIGSVRLHLSKGEFDTAQQLVDQDSSFALEADGFAGFHPAEVALRRLKRVLAKDVVSTPTAIQESKDCLGLLVKAAKSDNVYGQKAMLSAADEILNWPGTVAMQNGPSVEDVLVVLKGMKAALSTAADFNNTMYGEKLARLSERLEVMEYLQSIVRDAPGEDAVLLNTEFAAVRSYRELFAALLKNACFTLAENMWRSEIGKKLTTADMVHSVLEIPADVQPQCYASILTDVLYPKLSIGHELLPPLLSWACKTADAYDEPNGAAQDRSLEDAIFLLELIERATKDLRLKIHSSFSTYTPFVEKIGVKRRKVDARSNSSRNVTDMDISLLGNGSMPQDSGNTRPDTSMSNSDERPNPTILEIGRMQGGARRGQTSAYVVDETEESVELRLSSARCLKHARSLGLKQHAITLGTFVQQGGSQFIAQELVRQFSCSSSTHEDRRTQLCSHVQDFCQSTGAAFDEALIAYAKELCGGKNTSKKAIEEAASIATCGKTSTTKCQLTLITLRAALFCRYSPAWLSKLSQEAIVWAAGDSSLRSELEEASRLLLIDGIVGRYCGKSAKELFHVDNPRHAIRLLQFVAEHFEGESVLSDTMDLCDAFAHLSREDACCRVLQNTVLRGKAAIAEKHLEELYNRNVVLAKSTYSKVIMFCTDLMEEASQCLMNSTEASDALEIQRKNFQYSLSCALAFTRVALSRIHSHAHTNPEGFSTVCFDEASLESLMSDLERIDTLQKEYSLYLSLSSVASPKVVIQTVANMLSPMIDAYARDGASSFGNDVTQIKRACALLADSCKMQETTLWFTAVGTSACRLAIKSEGKKCLAFMSDLGVLKASGHQVSARSLLAVALCFCKKASRYAEDIETLRPAMEHIVLALSILQDNAMIHCPAAMLDKAVSISELCDVVSSVLIRTDEGIGESLDNYRKSLHEKSTERQIQPSLTIKSEHLSSTFSRPSLHPTWYVGDGLLLPPAETLSSGLTFCKRALKAPSSTQAALALHTFVDGRGAYGLGLRLLASTTATRASSEEQDPSYLDLEETTKQTTLALAERFVGGTGNGITSGIIDSQMAVASLLCLPLKMAFKVYRSSLPTAISTGDFARVITLANVGVAAGKGTMFGLSGAGTLEHWKRQNKFVVQCSELALRGKWWKILKENNVTFDPNRFQDQSQSKDKAKTSTKYVTSLVPPLLSGLAARQSNPEVVLKSLLNFTSAFEVPEKIAINAYVEYLLLPSSAAPSGTQEAHEPRKKLGRLDTVVKSLLRRLRSPVDRSLILRKCLRQLEQGETARDYERLLLVLSLYQVELGNAVPRFATEAAPPAIELELIDRRRDALAILTWFFQGEYHAERPMFSDFFVPLPDNWRGDYSQNEVQASREILGIEKTDTSSNFDPLAPLDKVLNSSKSATAAAALAPLCLPLGVPNGYVHARSLIARFKKSRHAGTAMPSFNDDVMPVLKRLKQPEDAADLAEWCSHQYTHETEDKLPCLDAALVSAMKASSTAEMRSNQRDGSDFVLSDDSISQALERVKRINAAKDLLADRLAVTAIMDSVAMVDQSAALSDLVQKLAEKLEEDVWTKDQFDPETFVHVLLSEASFLASQAVLCPVKALSIGQFRQLSIFIHRACNAIAEKYSHVQITRVAKRLAHRWLFHGDQVDSDKKQHLGDSNVEQEPVGRRQNTILQAIEEDDTINFVMDLNQLQNEDGDWSNDPAMAGMERADTRLTSEEEPSSLKVDGSAREISDTFSHRSSLRIAFVVAFSRDWSPNGTVQKPQDENDKQASNKKQGSTRLRSKLSARSSKKNVETTLEHSKELLRIVFARSVSADWMIKDADTSIAREGSEGLKQTLTFAMRHRALRAAAVLCPQDTLQQVVDDEDLIANNVTTLKKTAFAAFVAKEIEEMGLPLPHSDLAQLSAMHFPSYARTLWRHHRDDRRSKGRLLLLVLEMYLKDSISDYEFFFSVVQEMESMGLPRTLLLALERIKAYLEKLEDNNKGPFIEKTATLINRLLNVLSQKMFNEITSVLSSENTASSEEESWIPTLSRLAVVLKTFTLQGFAQENMVSFVEGVFKLSGLSGEPSEKLAVILSAAIRQVSNKDTKVLFTAKLQSTFPQFQLPIPREKSAAGSVSDIGFTLFDFERNLMDFPVLPIENAE